MTMRNTCCSSVAVAALLWAGAVYAQGSVTLAQTGSVRVTDQDLAAELERAPAQARASALERPETLQMILRTITARRVLAQEAQASGLGATPMVQAQVKLAQERALSDARLLEMDAQNEPDEAAILAYARQAYAADDKRFSVPAQTHARHILITGEEQAARAQAEALRAQLQAGESFEELAKAHSQDPGSAARGGDLGFFPAGRMVPEFDDALANLKTPGEISAPVKSQFGWHLIELVERQKEGKKPFEEVGETLRAEARQRLLAEKRTTKVSSLVDGTEYHKDAIEAFVRKQR